MIESFIGLPFVDRGRSMEGIDCWGLIMLMYKDMLGIALPDFPISAKDSEGVINAMGDSVSKGEWVKVNEPKFGDIIAMALCPRLVRSINHVGMHVGNNRFIHAIMDQRSASCRIDDSYWSKRIKGYYRWQG